MGKRALAALRQASRGGTLPIVCDASSCTEGLHELVAGASAGAMAAGEQQDIHVVDAVDFVLRSVLPRLSISRRLPSLALHPTCSSTRLGGNEALHDLASAIAEEVIVPDDWGCCAFAGDRGLLHPELTASATRDEALSLSHRRFTAYASCNRTCEMGLTRATGQEFQHLIELVEQATR
jgi:D-lactate dehydrogenase